jgi:hypothetical protein
MATAAADDDNDNNITFGKPDDRYTVNREQLWRAFCASNPEAVLQQELEYITIEDSWNDCGFSIRSLADVNRDSGVEQLFGVDLFVVQIVVFRCRVLKYSSAWGGQPSLSDHPEGEELSDESKRALNLLGHQIRMAAELENPANLDDYAEIDWVEGGNFRVADFLGAGAFGRVFKACLFARTANAALKVVTRVAAQEFREEVRILSMLRHPNLLRSFGTCTYQGCPGLFTELMDGDLESVLQDLTIGQRRSVILQVARGLEYLHRKETDASGHVTKPCVLHRDLKSANILMKADTTVVKIADFGLSRTIATSRMATTSSIGTPLFMAPEVFTATDTEPYGTAADVYSFALVIYEVLAKKRPYVEEPTFLFMLRSPIAFAQAVIAGARPSLDLICDGDNPAILPLVDLMQLWWVKNPAERPIMSAVVVQLSALP